MRLHTWMPGKWVLVAWVLGITPSLAQPVAPVHIVAAENFYGDLARQIAGPDAAVTSILSNPDDDPHLFEADPATARALASAGIVIANGADYDPWVAKLLAASHAPHRRIIVAAELLHRATGVNPHLWYDPATMPVVARALAAALTADDPAHKAYYAANLATFLASLQPITAKIAAMRSRFAGVPVTATEPVFGYMAQALGLVMHNERFQIAVMNDTEPSAGDTAAFERDLKTHRVRLLLYNSQASGAAPRRLLGIAQASHIPVVGVTETEPAGKSYQSWMQGELDAVDKALSAPQS
jgi:zinc/manganese transport system substrate-binding protein